LYGFEYLKRSAKKIHLYESASLLEKAQRHVEFKNSYGATLQVVDRAALLDLEPALQEMNASLVGGIYSPRDEVGDVRAFTRSAIEKSIELGGGQLLLSTRVDNIVIEHGKCRSLTTSEGDLDTDAVVICAGYQSSRLSRKLGFKISPIVPVTGYTFTFPESEYTPSISLTDTPNKFVLSRLGNQLRIAAMTDVGRVVSMPPKERIQPLKRLLLERFPKAADYDAEPKSWAGMRPMTADSRPIIEQTKIENVFVNSGHGMFGWTLAAGSAHKLAELITKNI